MRIPLLAEMSVEYSWERLQAKYIRIVLFSLANVFSISATSLSLTGLCGKVACVHCRKILDRPEQVNTRYACTPSYSI